MPRFVDRQRDFADLDRLLNLEGAQFLLVYGPRRVGKTTLLTRWATDSAARSGMPFIYWVASRNTPTVLRRGLTEALWRWQIRLGQGGQPWAEPSVAQHLSAEMPIFPTWRALFQQIAKTIGSRRVILILDEFSYAIESSRPLASELRNAWDEMLKDSKVFLVVSGSHVEAMEQLQHYDSPLYGRFTAQLPVDPLPFGALEEFFPQCSAAERVAVYAILGGMPGYLERFDDRQTLKANVQAQIFDRTGMFRLEPFAFISDEVREPRNYLAIMSAIARGHHTVESIVQVSGLKRPNVGGRYLQRLQELHIVERRVPATVPRDQRTTLGRYYLEDSYLRFYFRFVHPNLDLLELGLVDELWETIEEAMPAFVEQYTFRGLCGEWMRAQARMGTLPFRPQQVGEYWAADAQIDVVAISWRERAILLGEVRWSPDPVEPPALHELVAKAPLVAPEPDWHVYYILFARAGFTDVTRQEAEAQDMLLVDLETLDQDLRQAMAPDSA